MRAISLRQPWASRIVAGGKTIETRTHPGLRGAAGHRIAIHASMGGGRFAGFEDDPDLAVVAHLHGLELPAASRYFGAVIGTAYAVELRELTAADEAAAQCSIDANRWGLVLRDARPLAVPIPAKGKLGVWEWTPPEGFTP